MPIKVSKHKHDALCPLKPYGLLVTGKAARGGEEGEMNSSSERSDP